MIVLDKILKDHPQFFSLVRGEPSVILSQVTPPDEAHSMALCLFSQKTQLTHLEKINSPAWFIAQSLWEKHTQEISDRAQLKNATIVTCGNIQVAMALVLQYFDRRDSLRAYPDGLSPQAWIHPSAKIGKGVTIAPFTTIGPNVEIGDDSIIGPHCTIEGEVKLGAGCLLESHVFVGRQCEIGRACRIKPFASIGSDGFGYAPSQEGPLKIPQLGIVVLEDFVDIGSGTCIDRATLTRTRIGRGTKVDNLVHIAHNCDIGKYCFLTACFAMAGSSKIGDFFMTGGTCAVGDHVVIHPNVTLAGASVVTTDITEPGAFGGNPVQPMQEYLRTRSTTKNLPQMRKQILRILKHLGLED